MTTPGGNRLAVGFFGGAFGVTPGIQIFSLVGSRMVYRAGFDGQSYPSVIASQDFDGDGYGDLWEATDEGGHFNSWQIRGSTVRPLFEVTSGYFPTEQFFDLNRRRGIDLLVTTTSSFVEPAKAVAVDGLTGAVQVLADDGAVERYLMSVVDIDHNDLPDLRVAGQITGQPDSVRYFRNISYGGRWSFTPSAYGPTRAGA